MLSQTTSQSILPKYKVVVDKNPMEALENLWHICQKNNCYPTQLIFGSEAFSKIRKDPVFEANLNINNNQDLMTKHGVVGKLVDVDVLTDFYVEDELTLEWSVEPDEIIANIGGRLFGKL